MDIHPLPEWAWGNALPGQVVADLIDVADSCNEACLLADEAQLIYRRSGARLRPERELGQPPRHYLDLLAGWWPPAADYCGRMLAVYVQLAANFAISVAPTAGSLLGGTAAGQDSVAGEAELARLLDQGETTIPLVQVSPGRPEGGSPYLEGAETRQRINAELAHDHQQLMAAIEAFRSHRQTSGPDYRDRPIPATSRTWIEIDGPALGTSLHSYAANCLWLLAGITSAA
jgi:hypothetical protein